MDKDIAFSSIVDLNCYPINKHGSQALSEVVEVAKRRYSTEGIVTFPGFLLPEAVSSAVKDIERGSDKVW